MAAPHSEHLFFWLFSDDCLCVLKDPLAFSEFFSRIAECLALPEHLIRTMPTQNQLALRGREGEPVRGGACQDLSILERKICKVDKQEQQLR